MKMHFQNLRNKQLVCLTLSFLGFAFGWKAMGDTPWDTVNFALGIAVGVLVYLVALTVADGPLGPLCASKNLERVGLVNRSGETPILLHNKPNTDTPNGMILIFANRNIPWEKWEEKKADLEAAFNIYIQKIAAGKNRRTVIIYAVPADQGIPTMISWQSDFLSPADFVLTLGKTVGGVLTVNLATIPHILLGGATGSGKSVLLKVLLLQCLQKGASVYIADFKGGLDYPRSWEKSCHMIYDADKLADTLSELVGELQTRKKVLRRAECSNIHEYNTRVRHVYKRIIFGCDEIAELLDKTGRNKTEKEQIDVIIGYLSTLARQGRAMGIHLILATQRPDAAILPGQVKNNLDCRICGRSDLVLSQIILDNGSASEIPKDIPGRFVCNLGGDTEFQGYTVSDFEGVDCDGLSFFG